MQIYTLKTRDKRLLCLCLALVAFWIIFIIGAAICLIYCIQLAALQAENSAVQAIIFAASVIGISALAAAITYIAFYLARYKSKIYETMFEGKQFKIYDGKTEYSFTREDIISRAKCVLPRLIGKYDLTVKVRRYCVDGEVVIGAAQFTLIQLCEKAYREQTIKTFGIK